ncbi:MAG: LysM peptidoglycan-binding domain-containing protein [Rhodobacteraceae bacterium]|nr:LysM peptidoglycan-binding domain-containing protein [Paracoccaceae bacterium]
MANMPKEKISWPVVITCIIVAFIFFGDFVLDYFGFKGVNETVEVVYDEIKERSDEKITKSEPKSELKSELKSEPKSELKSEPELELVEPKKLSPTFDIVRVDPDGSGLIAGVANPGSKISLLMDGTPDVSTLVPDDGQFVLMFDLPKSGGPKSLSLKETNADGTTIISTETVLINPTSESEEVKNTPDVPLASGEIVVKSDSEEVVTTSEVSSVEEEIKVVTGEIVAKSDSEEVVTTSEVSSVEEEIKVVTEEIVVKSDSEGVVTTSEVSSVEEEIKVVTAEVALKSDSEVSATSIDENTTKKKPTIVIVDNEGSKVVQSSPLPVSPKDSDTENVVIDTITYDNEGEVAISGRGSAGDFVQIYLDNKPVLLTSIGVDGSWVTPLTNIKQGLYNLRADEVSKSGVVLSRVETPFQRENVVIAAKGASAITVQPGYTLWAIAREKYGSGFQYVRVYQANQDLIKNPDLIYPGQVFKLPEE